MVNKFFAVILLPVVFVLSFAAVETAEACYLCGYFNLGGYVVSAPAPVITSPPPVLYPYFNYGYNGNSAYSYASPYYYGSYYGSGNGSGNYNWGNYNSYWRY